MAHTGAGYSMHAFGQAYSVAGPIDTVFRQATMGFSIDEFCRIFSPALPQHIKLDVDSIEIKILDGAKGVLATHVKTVMVEIAGRAQNRTTKAEFQQFLSALGFTEDAAFMAKGATRNVLFRRTV
jgi:hypothetical protein